MAQKRELSLREAQAEPKEAIAVARAADFAARAMTAPGNAAPTTPTANAASATIRSFRIGLCRAAIVAEPITAPLPYIATHIIESEFVRTFSAYFMCLTSGIVLIPCHIVKPIAAAIRIAAALAASTGCVFPFCLCGHAESLSCQCI